MTDVKTDAYSRWQTTLIACVVVFCALLALFWPTALGMVSIWYNFDTYTHGFLILPLSIWLIWQKRSHLAAFTPQPTQSLLALMAGGLFVWALARLTGVVVIEQLAFVGILITALASILGWQVSKFLAFPLLFLLFAVPMGEDLVPPMMEFTATFTVGALKLTGIPVYRDGLWFSLPTGEWSVVEACSGVRYLIASVTLGFMYAYITYHTLWKRLLFIAMSALVPIFANGVRAYMIVMIGHLSEMEYATGVDHLIYGWFFFGIVMFILFWIGSYWQEDQAAPTFVAPLRTMSSESAERQVFLVSAVALVLAGLTVFGTWQAAGVNVQMAAKLSPPEAVGQWHLSEESAPWSVASQTTDHVVETSYLRGEDQVQLFVVLFPNQRQGSEAVSQSNKISDELVRSVRHGTRTVDVGDRQIPVKVSKAIIPVDGQRREYLVWQWYRLAGRNLINAYEGKAWEAIARIYPGRADGAWIAVATPLSLQAEEDAEKRLASFAATIFPGVELAIDTALGYVD